MTAHEKTTLGYRPTREASEQIVRMLCEHYPKCFFEDSRQRRPLKQKIVTDIVNDQKFDVSPELITAAVDWYKSHIGYAGYAMQVIGAPRIDLNGEAVGSVTEREAIAAQQMLDDYNRDKNERFAASPPASPVTVLHKMHERGQVSDDGVKKLDAPTTSPRSKAAAVAPEFTALYEAMNAANTAVSGISDPTMRGVVLKPLLDHLIKTFQQVRDQLNHKEE